MVATSAENAARAENIFPSVTAHRLQNAKKITIGALNVNSLRNKMGAVQELELILTYPCFQRLKLMKLFQANNFT